MKAQVTMLCLLAAVSGFAAMGVIEEDDPMAVAAGELLAVLDDEQMAACVFDFADAERRNWQPIPFGDAGVRLDEMTEGQRESVVGLLRTALSEDGVRTVNGVRVLEGILVAMAEARGQAGGVLGDGKYFITIYGDPGTAAPWAWRMEGHHLSITFTCKNGAWVAHGPLFVGSQPARVRGGEHDGMRLLGHKDDNVRALLGSLDEEQRASAVTSARLPGNIILLPGEDDGFDDPGGLVGSDMTSEQRAMLGSILTDWASWLRADLAKAEAQRMMAGLKETHFIWIGEMGVDAPHYWRIVGPHFAIEYAAPERDPDHVHALWRDTENDFGGDLLRKHLEEHHSGD